MAACMCLHHMFKHLHSEHTTDINMSSSLYTHCSRQKDLASNPQDLTSIVGRTGLQFCAIPAFQNPRLANYLLACLLHQHPLPLLTVIDSMKCHPAWDHRPNNWTSNKCALGCCCCFWNNAHDIFAKPRWLLGVLTTAVSQNNDLQQLLLQSSSLSQQQVCVICLSVLADKVGSRSVLGKGCRRLSLLVDFWMVSCHIYIEPYWPVSCWQQELHGFPILHILLWIY